LFGSNDTVTGIDLGAGSVKLARARAGRGVRRLLNAGVVDLPSGDDSGNWADRAGQALRKLLEEQKLGPRDLGRVLVAVSGPSVHLRQIDMPPLSDEELKAAVKFESRQHLPLDNLGEAAVDCQVIERRTGDKPGMSVLLVGAPENLIRSRLKVLNAAGVDPEVVDAAPLALLNALDGADPEALAKERTVALLDLGHSATTIVFARKGGVVYSRPLTVAGKAATADALASAFRETANFYAQMNERRTVDQVYLSGGGAADAARREALAAALGVPVTLLDATRRLTYSPGRGQTPTTDELAAEAPRLAVALGLLYWGDGGV
jgi:type IV pilus assembly protein PilM